MFKTIVDELIAIKKELQDIKLILKFHFLSNYKTERVKMDGETIINRYILPDPLEELRKEEHILQQSLRYFIGGKISKIRFKFF